MKILHSIARYMEYGSAAMVACLMMLTVADIAGRTFFNFPIRGTIETCSFMLSVMVALGLAVAVLERRHIKVDLVMDRLPKRAQFIIDNALLIVTFSFLAILFWYNAVSAIHLHRYTSILHLSHRPFKLVFSAGIGIMCICTLARIIENFRKRGKDGV